MVIDTRITWDRNLCLTFIQEVLREFIFCRENARNIIPAIVMLYADARSVACGVYSVVKL